MRRRKTKINKLSKDINNNFNSKLLENTSTNVIKNKKALKKNSLVKNNKKISILIKTKRADKTNVYNKSKDINLKISKNQMLKLKSTEHESSFYNKYIAYAKIQLALIIEEINYVWDYLVLLNNLQDDIFKEYNVKKIEYIKLLKTNNDTNVDYLKKFYELLLNNYLIYTDCKDNKINKQIDYKCFFNINSNVFHINNSNENQLNDKKENIVSRYIYNNIKNNYKFWILLLCLISFYYIKNVVCNYNEFIRLNNLFNYKCFYNIIVESIKNCIEDKSLVSSILNIYNVNTNNNLCNIVKAKEYLNYIEIILNYIELYKIYDTSKLNNIKIIKSNNEFLPLKVYIDSYLEIYNKYMDYLVDINRKNLLNNSMKEKDIHYINTNNINIVKKDYIKEFKIYKKLLLKFDENKRT